MSHSETGNLRTETQLISAIKTLQRFGNIPQTGEIDDATRELMQRPRCGQPDVSPNNRIGTDGFRNRVKRAQWVGPKWDHTNLKWR